MQLLHDVMDSQARKLTLQIPIEQLESGMIDELKELFNSHKGDKQLHFTIYEVENKVKLNMPSRKQKIHICNELLEELQRVGVKYRLN